MTHDALGRSLAVGLHDSVAEDQLVAQPRPLPDGPTPRSAPPRGRPTRMGPRWRLPWRRTARIAGIVLLALVVLIALASVLLDEPMRRTVESRMNAAMKGYTVHIGKLDFHPLGFGVTLYDLTFAQNAYPDPPVLAIKRLDASVEWKALLRAALVANFRLEEPRIHVHLAHLREELKDPTPIEKKGWQEAFQAIYPLKIDELAIVDGAVVYVDPGPFEPLKVTDIQAKAKNIRNVHSRDRDYPSELTASAVVFDSGALRIEGHADFLKEPFLGVKGNISLDKIPLDYFRPVTNRYNLSVRGGVLTANGLVEYAPTIKVVDLDSAEVRGVKIDYIQTPQQAGAAQQATRKTAETAQQTGDRADLLVRARQVRVSESEVGVINKTADPDFRVFMTAVNLEVQNVTNQRQEGIGRTHLTGRFMGNGPTEATLAISDPKGPDFDFVLKIEKTDMRAMNPILRQYGKFDVTAGTFSMYSELKGRDGRVNGYVKPLFKDVKAYDPAQDRDKGFVKRMYEKLVTGVSKILKNPPRDEVATKVNVEGRLDQPQTSTLQAIGNLLRNAFIEAILPGLDQELRGSSDRGSSRSERAEQSRR